MLRALFLREFCKSWLAHAGLLLVVIGTATVLEHALSGGVPHPEDQLTLTHLLMAGLACSGLISGERCFSRAFKEGRYPFLLSLPAARGRIWLAYLGGRLIGALAALPALLPARPVLLDQVFLSPRDPVEPSILIAMLAMYLVLFLGGAMLALAVHKEILVYLTGLPLLSSLLGLLALSAASGFDILILPESSPFLQDLSLGSIGLALVEAALARRAFCRGEPNLGSRMAQTLAEVALALAVFIALALAFFSSLTLAALRDEWQPVRIQDPLPVVEVELFGTNFVSMQREPRFPYSDDMRSVSADGRFLVILQHLQKRAHFTRLAIVDLKSGRPSRWLERPGIRQISWSPSEAVLNVLATDDAIPHPLGLLWSGSTSWYRLAPDLQLLSREKFQGLGRLQPLTNGNFLLTTQRRDRGTLYWLSGRDGGTRKILTSGLNGDPSLWALGQGAAVAFPQAGSLRAWWLDAEGRIQHQESVRWSGPPYDYYLFGYRVLSSAEAWSEMIRHAFSSRSSRPVEPLLPSRAAALELNPVSFLIASRDRKVAVYRLRGKNGLVRVIGEYEFVDLLDVLKNGPLSSMILKTKNIVVLSYTMDFDLDAWTWTWSATATFPLNQRYFLYDGKELGRIPNTMSCSESKSAELKRVQGLGGLLVQYECSGRAGRRFLRLVPGSGVVQELPWLSDAVPPDLFDHWIYLDPDRISVWVSMTGEVWRHTPGQKPLRLNPPQEQD